jgi:hypothetical protein
MLTQKEREWVENRFDRIEIAIAKLQVKSGYWGVIGGVAAVLVYVGVGLVMGK